MRQTSTATEMLQAPIEVRGCDLFGFQDGRIRRKDTFWKVVS